MALSELEILSELADILNENGGKSSFAISRKDELTQVGLDGDTVHTIVLDIQAKFNVEVAEADLADLRLVGDLVALIQSEQH